MSSDSIGGSSGVVPSGAASRLLLGSRLGGSRLLVELEVEVDVKLIA